MFCPRCRAEYRPGFTECSDCHVQLVPELPEEPEVEFAEYEEVLSTNNPGDRAILKSILDAEGITYYFQGEHVSAYLYHAIPVRLMVEKDDVERVKEIVKDLQLSFTFGGQHMEDSADEGE